MTDGQGTSRFLIPLSPGRDVALEGTFPVTGQEWDQFMAVLEAMKPGLLEAAAPKGQDPEE